MPSGGLQCCPPPTLFEVHLGMSWSLSMCYLLPRTVTGRICSRSLKLFFQDFLWLEAVGCAFCSWLCHRAESSVCPPSDSCLVSTKEVLAVKVPWHSKGLQEGQDIVTASLTGRAAVRYCEWKEQGLTPKRCKLKCQLFHWLSVSSWPQSSHL